MAAMESLGDIAEIVEIILRFLPGRCIAIAAQVCHLWRDTVERIRRSRRKCAVYLSPRDSNFSECSRDVLDFIRQQNIEPRALLLFSGSLPSSSTSFIKTFLQSVRNCLPVNCPLIGCTGLGVIGSDQTNSGQPQELENSPGLSLMMFPRCDGLEIRDFYIPLRNKYKNISGIKSFLPSMALPVKLVIVLAHPLSLGKLTNLTLALRSKYGDDVRCIRFKVCFIVRDNVPEASCNDTHLPSSLGLSGIECLECNISHFWRERERIENTDPTSRTTHGPPLHRLPYGLLHRPPYVVPPQTTPNNQPTLPLHDHNFMRR